MTLDDIGFYTLSEERAKQASVYSPVMRVEILLTGRCNFKCPYCRRVGGKDQGLQLVRDWIATCVQHHLENIRFSGGEPTLYPHLRELVQLSRQLGVKRVALSTNGSAHRDFYQSLIEDGVDDFSVSLDACCALDGDRMAGTPSWNRVVNNIRFLASRVYTTVGIVLTPDSKASETIAFAATLGVQDIRVIPAAQDGKALSNIQVDKDVLARHPILRYRMNNMYATIPVRGLWATDSHRCGLVLDDLAVLGEYHYPCIIYLREGGKPIGKLGPQFRWERVQWFQEHDTHLDPICKNNCLDVCAQYNNAYEAYHSRTT